MQTIGAKHTDIKYTHVYYMCNWSDGYTHRLTQYNNSTIKSLSSNCKLCKVSNYINIKPTPEQDDNWSKYKTYKATCIHCNFTLRFYYEKQLEEKDMFVLSYKLLIIKI